MFTPKASEKMGKQGPTSKVDLHLPSDFDNCRLICFSSHGGVLGCLGVGTSFINSAGRGVLL